MQLLFCSYWIMGMVLAYVHREGEVMTRRGVDERWIVLLSLGDLFFCQCITMLCAWQVGSIEGRVAVQHIDEAQQSKNFTFKCHRDNNDIYAVNAISFHPVSMKEGYYKPSMPKSLKVVFGVSWVDIHVDLVQVHATFATSGSDGAYNFWDKDSRQRLKVFLFQQDFWVLFSLRNVRALFGLLDECWTCTAFEPQFKRCFYVERWKFRQGSGWDMDSSTFLEKCSWWQALQRCNQPIPCSAFNHDGTIFAYAVRVFLTIMFMVPCVWPTTCGWALVLINTMWKLSGCRGRLWLE
jgi:hypothetical protein